MNRNRLFKWIVALAMVAAITFAASMATASPSGKTAVSAEDALSAYRQGEKAGRAASAIAASVEKALIAYRQGEKLTDLAAKPAVSVEQALFQYRQGEHSVSNVTGEAGNDAGKALIEWQRGEALPAPIPDAVERYLLRIQTQKSDK